MPNTRNWKAWQDLQPGPGKPRLIVTGEVEVTNTNQTPNLNERSPQGINQAILLLDLTITTAGVGNTVITWRTARFEKGIRKDQYSNVEIFSGGERVADVKVETVQ